MPRRLKELSEFKTVRDLVINNSKEFKDKPAVFQQIGSDQNGVVYDCVTYSRLYEDWKFFSNYLIGIGLTKSERVVLAGKNSYALSLAYLALAGGVGLPAAVDPRTPKEKILDIFEDLGALYAIVDREYEDKLPKGAKTIVTDEIPAIIEAQKEKDPNAELIPINVNPDRDPAIIVLSDGVSEKHKAVSFTNTKLYENVDTIRGEIHISHTDRFLSVIPLSSYAEIYMGLLFPMSRGASVIYEKELPTDADSITNSIKDFEATTMVCHPAILDCIYSMLWKSIVRNNQVDTAKEFIAKMNVTGTVRKGVKQNSLVRMAPIIGPEMKLVISTGSVLTNRVSNGMRAFGVPIIDIYGMAECPIAAISSPLNRTDTEKNFRPSDIEMKIENAEGENFGKILIRGRRVSKAYENISYNDSRPELGNWLDTGDYGSLDENEKLTFFGKACYALRSEYKNKYILPEQIENKIASEYGLVEAFVYPKKTENGYVLAAKVRPEEAVVINRGIEATDSFVRETVDDVNAIFLKYKKLAHIDIVYSPLDRTISQRVVRTLPNESNKISSIE